MPTKITSVLNFLSARKSKHAGHDLIDRFLQHGPQMEIQVNVAAGQGERVPGSKSTFTDGVNRWYSYRIPKNADSVPEFHDSEIGFALDEHCEGIGSTGWDWVARCSRWVAFDFDAIVGHAAGVGVEEDELARVRHAAQALPYVETRRSTGGSGIHLYVIFEDGVPTNNHTEHAALARCVLGIMSRDAGFDFSAQIDACGGNMWLWHRKCNLNNEGLKLLKPAERPFRADEVPSNWRDHLDVITRQRNKVRVQGVNGADEDPFEMLASAHRRVTLDAKHKLFMDEIAKLKATVVWIPDHHLLQTHTAALAILMNGTEQCLHCHGSKLEPGSEIMSEFEMEFEPETPAGTPCTRCKGQGTTRIADRLGLQGIFQTNSKGSDLATPNCFAFPGDDGTWKVYRFSPGISEARTWEQDGRGWTTCWFNRPPDLKTAAKSLGGRELKSGGFEFDTLGDAAKVASLLNPKASLPIEDHLTDRKAIVSSSKDGRFAIELPKRPEDPQTMGEWNNTDKKTSWTQVFNVPTTPAVKNAIDVTDYDNIIRCLKTPTKTHAGWAVKEVDGNWTINNSSNAKMVLQHLGHKKPEAEEIMGHGVRRTWKLVTLPFQPEYPGNRQWNRDAPQLRFQPASRDEEGTHLHWDRVFEHVGNDLTPFLKGLSWAVESGIRTGADYLRAIFAAILREPFEHTPYLFLFGPENSGKSILHESFELLVTSGVVKADRSLTNQSDFNGELAGAIMCVVEEKDISKTPGAHAKIKDAVTALKLSIRKMRTDAYMVPNMTHWVQCANSFELCPVFTGDSRVTMIYVPELPEGREIPKTVLLSHLEAEAPAFLRTLMDLQLPPSTGRLRIPVVATDHKRRAQLMSRSPLEAFIQDHLYEVPGSLIPFADFYTKFIEWVSNEERINWSRIKVSRAMPMKWRTGAYTGNKTYIINAAWEMNPEIKNSVPFTINENGKLRRVDAENPS